MSRNNRDAEDEVFVATWKSCQAGCDEILTKALVMR
jgi:hypothetical protein